MRSMRQRLAAVTLLGGLTTLGIGLTAGPASARVDYCLDHLASAQSGSLHMTSTPAAGSDVATGSDIAFQASWDDQDWVETDRFYLCSTVAGVFNNDTSFEDLGVNNNGSYSAASSLPASLPVGSDVCYVGVLRGRLADETQGNMVSETLCFRSAAVATTTTTMAPATTDTTVAPVVEPAVVDAGTPSAPAVEAAPAPVEDPAPLPQLPRTGSGVGLLAGVGGIALALGGLTRLLGRRRSSEA